MRRRARPSLQKLAAIIPPPPAGVAERQKRALEDAIASVERDYAKSVPESDPLAELEDVFSSIDRNKNQSSHVRQPVKTEPAKAADACRHGRTELASQPVASAFCRADSRRACAH